MAEEIKKAKVTRQNKLSAFTRKRNHLKQLIDGGAQSAKLEEAYRALSDAFKVLEIAQEDFMLVVDEGALEEEAAYLDASAGVLSQMDLRLIRLQQIKKK